MKKNIYLFFTTCLGILSGTMIVTLSERWIINNALSQGFSPQPYFYILDYGYIPQFFSIGIIIISALLGLYYGKKWWKMVYIEKRHWRKYKK